MTTIKAIKAADLTPDPENANRGTDRGRKMLEESLQTYGAGRSILIDREGRVIAGNKTLQTAADLGLDDVIVVQTDGRQVVAVQRVDLDLATDDRARLLAFADNRVGQADLDFDPARLLEAINRGLDLSSLWYKDELDVLLSGLLPGGENPYTDKIKAPTYTPSGIRPKVADLYDDSRTRKLLDEIEAAEGLTEEERAFLRVAAQRHTVLNFSKIADYYAHADTPLQDLMENSALVVIDFGKAIALGYVLLTKNIAEMVRDEYGDE